MSDYVYVSSFDHPRPLRFRITNTRIQLLQNFLDRLFPRRMLFYDYIYLRDNPHEAASMRDILAYFRSPPGGSFHIDPIDYEPVLSVSIRPIAIRSGRQL
uniref:Uncharacterized protein n=1 Tax=Tetranychus urticae TaxID=32264 RepID=T1L1Z9_TETUR